MDPAELLRVGSLINDAAAGLAGPDPRSFKTAVGEAMNAYSAGARLTADPFAAAKRDLQTVPLLDTTDNRIGMAVTDHYKGDRRRVLTAMTRFGAMFRRLEDPQAERWFQRGPGPSREILGIHKSVVAAAATLPVEAFGDFPVDAFWNAVEGQTADSES